MAGKKSKIPLVVYLLLLVLCVNLITLNVRQVRNYVTLCNDKLETRSSFNAQLYSAVLDHYADTLKEQSTALVDHGTAANLAELLPADADKLPGGWAGASLAVSPSRETDCGQNVPLFASQDSFDKLAAAPCTIQKLHKQGLWAFSMPVTLAGSAQPAVFSCFIREDSIQQQFAAALKDVQGTSLLISADGSVLSSVSKHPDSSGIQKFYEYLDQKKVSQSGLAEIRNQINRGSAGHFNRLSGNLSLSFAPVSAGTFTCVFIPDSDFPGIVHFEYIRQYIWVYSGVFVLVILLIIFHAMMLRKKRQSGNQEKQSLENRLQLDETFLDQTESMAAEIDLANGKILCSSNFARTFGDWEKAIVNYSLESFIKFFYKEDQPLMTRLMKDLSENKPYFKTEARLTTTEGQVCWFSIRITCYFKDKKPNRLIAVLTNINQQKHETQSLLRLAQRDSMTKLYNKQTTLNLIQDFLESSGRYDNHALMFLDVDFFKNVNDTYGHLSGDSVLKMLSTEVSELFRDNDVVGRVGGDEFLIFIKNIHSHNHMRNKALSICEVFKHISTELNIPVSGSIGISVFLEDSHNADELIEHADVALYAAKRNGKNCVMFYDECNGKG